MSRALDNKSKRFHKAISEHGCENFIWQVMCECSDKESLNIAEKAFIAYYNSADPSFGYNMTYGGGGKNSGVPTDEVRKKIATKSAGRRHSEATLVKMRAVHVGMKGRRHSEQTIEKIKRAAIEKYEKNPPVKGSEHWLYGKSQTLTDKRRLSFANRQGRSITDDHKMKISIALKGKPKSKEHVDKVRIALTGRKFSEEHKKALSVSHVRKHPKESFNE